jgi:hypothetical protein
LLAPRSRHLAKISRAPGGRKAELTMTQAEMELRIAALGFKWSPIDAPELATTDLATIAGWQAEGRKMKVHDFPWHRRHDIYRQIARMH